MDWLMGLLRETMESTFIWVSQNKDILASTEEYLSLGPDYSKQVLEYFTRLFFQFILECFRSITIYFHKLWPYLLFVFILMRMPIFI